jgi:putative Mg2+ transporter-C (MgtC) family protein
MEELTISYGQVVLRLLVSAALCGLIGFEREVRDHPAGFRTHILLGVGATLFALVSAYGYPEFAETALRRSGGLQFDPTRITAQIVTGVGFLGAGAIIRQGRDIRGLTTAASLWAAAAIGTAVGAGYLFGAAAATLVAIVTLYALRIFRSSVIGRFQLYLSDLSFTLDDPAADPAPVLETLKRHEISIRNIDVEIDKERARYDLQVRIRPPHDARGALREVSGLPGVSSVSISDLSSLD